ncbi:glycoside hydrolase family 5 protein [Fimbriiglobus ruber]|uniref:Endoglucanase, glycosyl hydrolase family 5 n=1 Tax=Fimbriiglobus ruber TaxID=1908690 RepID=A0A225DK53_9BACT|nr:cellulase family glycosylhydrolase [Fimbriiglobus ruber]OWK41850.1 Endoglucanase, glycosyl hydrolase family 5 [Fimbriiglobus ruber]
MAALGLAAFLSAAMSAVVCPGEVMAGPGQKAGSQMPLPLKVDKTHVVNSRGERVRLRGVNAPDLAWSSDGEGHRVIKAMEVALNDWHANIIRLPLSLDRWFGKAPHQKDGGKSYRVVVHQAVELCASHRSYIILDLHETHVGEWGKNLGYHCMPDRTSLDFWKEVAETYKNHPAVIFDLFNEPNHVSWEVWQHGGKVNETLKDKSEHEYETAGMQAMLDTVRATGAKNVVIVGGLNFASDLSWFKKGNRLDDRGGNGMLYAFHWYGVKGESMAQRVVGIEKVVKSLPVIVSEFGSGLRESDKRFTPEAHEQAEQWLRQVLQVLEDGQCNWVAWSMHSGAFPCLITDSKFTPSPWFGSWVQKALLGKLPRYEKPR